MGPHPLIATIDRSSIVLTIYIKTWGPNRNIIMSHHPSQPRHLKFPMITIQPFHITIPIVLTCGRCYAKALQSNCHVPYRIYFIKGE